MLIDVSSNFVGVKFIRHNAMDDLRRSKLVSVIFLMFLFIIHIIHYDILFFSSLRLCNLLDIDRNKINENKIENLFVQVQIFNTKKSYLMITF